MAGLIEIHNVFYKERHGPDGDQYTVTTQNTRQNTSSILSAIVKIQYDYRLKHLPLPMKSDIKLLRTTLN